MSETVDSRNPSAVLRAAMEKWQAWQPGDGTKYQVRVISIGAGPDHSDHVLLLNVGRQTLSFQYPTVLYRKDSDLRWSAKRAEEEDVPFWAYRAAAPLLKVAWAASGGHVAVTSKSA